MFFCRFVSNPITERQQGVLGGSGQTNCVSKRLTLHKLKNLTSGIQSLKQHFFTSFWRKKMGQSITTKSRAYYREICFANYVKGMFAHMGPTNGEWMVIVGPSKCVFVKQDWGE